MYFREWTQDTDAVMGVILHPMHVSAFLQPELDIISPMSACPGSTDALYKDSLAVLVS